jgi:hypothetical protein
MNTDILFKPAVCAAFSLLAIASINEKPQEQATGPAESGEESMPRTAPAETTQRTASIGEKVTFEDSEWVVLKAVELGELLLGEDQKNITSQGGRFIYVRYQLKNLTKEEEQITFTPQLMDSEGRNYEEHGESESYLPDGENGLTNVALPASLPRTFAAIYEVPLDSEGLLFMTRSFALMRTEQKPVVLQFSPAASAARESMQDLEEPARAAISDRMGDAGRPRPEDTDESEQTAEERLSEKLAELKGSLAEIESTIGSERERWQNALDTINRLTNFKKTPVREGSPQHQQCLRAAEIIREVESGAAELKAQKAKLEATIKELEQAQAPEPKNSLVGKWMDSEKPGSFWEFKKDFTGVRQAPERRTFTWKLTSEGKFEISLDEDDEFPAQVVNYEYNWKGSSLILWPQGLEEYKTNFRRE